MSFNIRAYTLLLLLSLLGACSSHTMSMKYQPTVDISPPSTPKSVLVSDVVDNRNTPPNWLGAIRGGYGNTLKKLYTSDRVDKEFARTLEQALKARHLLADAGTTPLLMSISLEKFDASQMFRKEAHSHFTLTLKDGRSDKTLFTKAYRTDIKAGGSGPGVFGSPSDLGAYANQALNESIDSALDDADFLQALHRDAESADSAQLRQANKSSPTVRLQELQALKDSNLITDAEYLAKRYEILNTL